MNQNNEKFIPRKIPIRRFNFVSATELIANQSPPKWLVRDYFEVGTIACLVGPSGSGKTFIALDIGLCVAAGKIWHGLPVTQGPVLFVCGEGRNGISRRVNAWYLENNIQSSSFFVSSVAAQLLDNVSLSEVKAAAAEIMIAYGRPVLIIIDTLNRNFGDGDENSTKDMTKFVAAVDQLRNDLGCSVVIVHHTGLKDKDRGRGSTVLRAAIDFEYVVTRNGEVITIKATKIKDFDSPPTLGFTPVKVDLGLLDEENRPITSIVLKLAETQGGSKSKAEKMSRASNIALEALKDVSSSSGQATEEDWRSEAYARGISRSEKPDTMQTAFRRAREILRENGLIDSDGDYYFPVQQDDRQTGQ